MCLDSILELLSTVQPTCLKSPYSAPKANRRIEGVRGVPGDAGEGILGTITVLLLFFYSFHLLTTSIRPFFSSDLKVQNIKSDTAYCNKETKRTKKKPAYLCSVRNIIPEGCMKIELCYSGHRFRAEPVSSFISRAAFRASSNSLHRLASVHLPEVGWVEQQPSVQADLA